MNRDVTNFIRLILDNFLPPVLRQSKIVMYPLFYIWYKGKNVSTLMDFKKDIETMSEEEYVNYYRIYNSAANRETDLNNSSIEFILEKLNDRKEARILDVGCGSGYLLKQLKQKGYKNLTGSDIIYKINDPDIAFQEANIEKLPFPDKSFDIVVCNHTLEHVINLPKAIQELKRIAKNQLIITVPRQNYNKYTFDLHVNFFPEKFDLTRVIGIDKYEIQNSAGDWSFSALLNNN